VLVTDNFIFVHIPKTGGTFVDTVLREHLPTIDFEADRHAPYSTLPKRWRNLPAFCVIRNPWDWYVSWYHYPIQSKPGQPRGNPVKQGLWESAFDEGRASFREATRRACLGEIDHPLAPKIRREGIDLYTAHVRTIVGSVLDRPNFTVLRFERLQRQLLRFLRQHGGVSRELKSALRHGPPIRASDRGPYRDYYSDELRELVGERAGWLREQFGYNFQ
jgi:hypothetical protein